MNNFQKVLELLKEAVKPKPYNYGLDENFSNKKWINLPNVKRTYFKINDQIYFTGLIPYKDGVSISFGKFKGFDFDFTKLEDTKYLMNNFDFKAANKLTNSSDVLSAFFFIALEGCDKFGYNVFYIIPAEDENKKLPSFYLSLVKKKIFLDSLKSEYGFTKSKENELRFER